MNSRRLAVVVLLLGIVPPASAGSVRSDPVDENFLVGHFFWNEGTGGISWDAVPSSQDDVDHGVEDFGFTSGPVPRTLYLNVSRMVQLDLFLKQPPEHTYPSVAIYVDDVLVAGGDALHHTEVRYCEGTTKTACMDPAERPAPFGYSVNTFRMQAELDTIEKGRSLRVEVSHASNAGDRYVSGLAGDHRSVLRLPLYSPDEILFRVPKYQRGADATVPESAPPGDPLRDLLDRLLPAAAAPVLLPLLVAARRAPSRRAATIALILATLAFAGCAAPNDGPKEIPSSTGLGGTAQTYIVRDEDNDTGIAHAATGSIFGVVYDEEFVPVNGAYVILLGTPRSTTTSQFGRFQFTELAVGSYGLRVDRAGFKAYQGEVRVEAASLTKVEVSLDYESSRERDQRPHRHDYWEGRTSITLLEASPTTHQGCLVVPPPQLILPGTMDIVVNMTWNGGREAHISTQRADDPVNATFLLARPSGQAFHLRTSWEMTDPGHAKFTYWGAFCYGFPLFSSCGVIDVNCHLNPVEPNYRLTVTVVKGIVPLEPPHADHWRANSAITVVNNETRMLERDCGLGTCPLSNYNDGPFNCDVRERRICEKTTDRAYNSSWQVPTFVPFETAWIALELRASRGVTGSDAETPWQLFYRGARTSNHGSCHAWDRAFGVPSDNRIASRPATLLTTDAANRAWTWKIELGEGEADAPYAKRSNWCFFVAPKDQNPQLIDERANVGQPPVFTLTAVVHRTESTSSA